MRRGSIDCNPNGRCVPMVWGEREWGRYLVPRQFAIIINDMSEVASHQDAQIVRGRSVSISSTLSDGMKLGGICTPRRKLKKV